MMGLGIGIGIGIWDDGLGVGLGLGEGLNRGGDGSRHRTCFIDEAELFFFFRGLLFVVVRALLPRRAVIRDVRRQVEHG